MQRLLASGLFVTAMFAFMPQLAFGELPAGCAEITKARGRLATDSASHRQRLVGIERGLNARRVRYQLRTELLRADLRKQYQSGIALTPAQERQLIEAEQLAQQMGVYNEQEKQLIAVTEQNLSRLEGDYRLRHGAAWTECPGYRPLKAAGLGPAADPYTVAQRPVSAGQIKR